MTYQYLELSKKEQETIKEILIKDNTPRNLKLSPYAGQVHRFYFVSYKIPQEFVVLDEEPSAHSYKAIIDAEKQVLLPNSVETLSEILKSLELFCNNQISDNDIAHLISKTIYNEDLITSHYHLVSGAELPIIQREEAKIICTAYLETSRGMMMPLLSRCTITIDSAYHITNECVDINPF